MKRLHKLTQQRRRQLHVHMPPSGLALAVYESKAKIPLQAPPCLHGNAALHAASTALKSHLSGDCVPFAQLS
ncbi:hypothetical protein KSS94_15325 [Pseudomonas fakonensis]|uniref:Uncharacterized protein n=1 Tax=Pseudomonas fakonensis TaxID=2842355 RepID=A0ABX8MZ11_9PSED|nr:hypothetical protein [Pseudomonas fakonensis]QXH49324.1 hypothetical protein KSS94_15325 [Pseudomonas fakonensis]